MHRELCSALFLLSLRLHRYFETRDERKKTVNMSTRQCTAINYTANSVSGHKNRLTTDDAPAVGARYHSNHADAGRSCSRTVFTRAQLDAMENRFMRQSFLTREERIEFAEEIQLTERQILVWFQNRR